MKLTHGMEKPDFCFAVLSDAHVTHRGQGIEKFTDSIMQLSAMEPKPDALLLDGDIVYQIDRAGGGVCDRLYTEPYHMVKDVLKRYWEPTPLVWVNGNHEFPQGRHEKEMLAEALAMYKEETGREIHFHQKVNGYHFVCIGLEDDNWAYTKEAEAWAIEELKKALKECPGKPVFFACHIPVQDTVIGSEGGGAHTPEMIAFLNKNPRILAIVGHLHLPCNDPRTVYQKEGGYTTVHSPLLAVGNLMVYPCENNTQSGNPISQGLYVEVKGSLVYIHKLDFMTESEVDEPWEFDVSALEKGEGYYYTDRRKEIAEAPAFPPKTKLICEALGDGKVKVDFAKATCKPAGKSQDGTVPLYRFNFTENGGNAVVKSVTLCTDFFLPKPGERFSNVISTGLPQGKYQLSVIPIHFFGKEGAPISCKVKIK